MPDEREIGQRGSDGSFEPIIAVAVIGGTLLLGSAVFVLVHFIGKFW